MKQIFISLSLINHRINEIFIKIFGLYKNRSAIQTRIVLRFLYIMTNY